MQPDLEPVVHSQSAKVVFIVLVLVIVAGLGLVVYKNMNVSPVQAPEQIGSNKVPTTVQNSYRALPINSKADIERALNEVDSTDVDSLGTQLSQNDQANSF